VHVKIDRHKSKEIFLHFWRKETNHGKFVKKFSIVYMSETDGKNHSKNFRKTSKKLAFSLCFWYYHFWHILALRRDATP